MEYIKTLGYMYDLVRIFIYHFNKEVFEKRNDKESFDKINEDFPVAFADMQIAEDLKIFFYIGQNNKSFMGQYIFYDNLPTMSVDDITSHLQKIDLFSEILQFYTGDSSIHAHNISPNELCEMIKKMNIPDDIKFALICFSMSKGKYIDLLIKELTEKAAMLNEYYAENEDKISDIISRLEDTSIKNDLFMKCKLSKEQSENCVFSVSLLQYNLLYWYYMDEKVGILLGCDVIKSTYDTEARTIPFNLSALGKAFADDNRIKILNMLRTIPEVTHNEICDRLGIAFTTSYYHLNMLYDAGILNIRTEGKKIFYRLNYDFFDKFGDHIKKFIMEEGVTL